MQRTCTAVWEALVKRRRAQEPAGKGPTAAAAAAASGDKE